MDSPASLADPFACTLVLQTRANESKGLKKIYGSVLKGIDPNFQLVTVRENGERSPATDPADGGRLRRVSRSLAEDRGTDCTLETPAIGIMLFLREELHSERTADCLSAAMASERLKSLPFRFHHKIEVTNTRKGQPLTIARQDFYMTSPEYPLISVSPVHYGKEHLRFNIFTYQYSQMVEFYRILTEREITHSKPGYCLFTVYQQPGLDIQLSLKYTRSLNPRPVRATLLRFRVKDLRTIEPFLCCKARRTAGGNDWLTCDPDGNLLLLRDASEAAASADGAAAAADLDSVSASSFDSDEDEIMRIFSQSHHSSEDSGTYCGEEASVDPSEEPAVVEGLGEGQFGGQGPEKPTGQSFSRDITAASAKSAYL